jgi:aminoglycoside phosphotransferase (APT) family kinase protein
VELKELGERLIPFCRVKYDDPNARVHDVTKMPGHAGFAYGFSVTSRDVTESWFIRLPPPNVQWKGTADVLRQVEILNALDRTNVPHCSVKWSGNDLEWFGCPYFVVPKLEGDVLRLGKGDWGTKLSDEKLHDLGAQAMRALAGIHKVSLSDVPYLGEPIPFEDDVTRWDRFYERAADPEKLSDVPAARKKLLEKLPTDAPVGVFHGDFQTANLFCSFEGDLLAVIDFELVGVGATLNDVGWIATFSDPMAWPSGGNPTGAGGGRPMFLDPETLVGLYTRAYGAPLPDLNWFRALAAYKFAIITGFNLSLHRRGKRVDPTWEVTAHSMTPLINRALELLG